MQNIDTHRLKAWNITAWGTPPQVYISPDQCRQTEGLQQENSLKAKSYCENTIPGAEGYYPSHY